MELISLMQLINLKGVLGTIQRSPRKVSKLARKRALNSLVVLRPFDRLKLLFCKHGNTVRI